MHAFNESNPCSHEMWYAITACRLPASRLGVGAVEVPSNGPWEIALKCRSSVVKNLTFSRASVHSLDSSVTWLKKVVTRDLSVVCLSTYLQLRTMVQGILFILSSFIHIELPIQTMKYARLILRHALRLSHMNLLM